MQHTLIAVFDNRNDAQNALEDLVSSGFTRSQARLSEGDPTGDTSAASNTGVAGARANSSSDGSILSGIRHFFSDMFGTDRGDDARMYSEAVSRGHYVLTLGADSLTEVERAADIVERYGPVDIDEQSQQWAGATALDSALYGAGARQDAQPMSQQLAPDAQGKQESTLQGGQGMQGSKLQGGQNLQDPTLQGGMVQGGQSMQDGMLRGTQKERGAQQRADTTAIPVIQEELKVGKREIQRGGGRIYQRVVETPVHESIGLREEHVNVERHPVNRPLEASDVNAFQETTIELRETAEEAVVEKTVRVVEEVVVGKEVSQRNEQVSDTVRRTEVEVEQIAPEDESNYRGHWNSNYAGQGGNYEDYAPAYAYGSTMARSQLYRGRPWNDVESNLRSDWETRNPGSAWEKMKAAVRHGWDRITS